jgi:hypothetical protein
MTTATTTTPEIREWDDEWLVRRGNYLTIITPELAARLLERNTNNRNPKLRAIEDYTRDMRAGKWDPDASDLKLSRTGELIDGQNRLMACIAADRPFPTLVRTCVSLDAKAHVDTGVKRTIGDVLKMEHIHGRPSTVGASVLLRYRYEDRVRNHGGRRLANATAGGGGRGRQMLTMTHDEVLDFLARHPAHGLLAERAESLRRAVMPALLGSSILAFCAMAHEIDPDLLGQMDERLRNAEFGPLGDPLSILVQYAASARSSVHRGRVAQDSHLLALAKVWNALRSGEPMDGRLHPKLTDLLVLPE